METPNDPDLPYQVFRFQVTFYEDPVPGTKADTSLKEKIANKEGKASEFEIAHGSFSEVTGIEATMEPKVIRAGGHNVGAVQRMGPVSHATVVLKRGMTKVRDLHTWFDTVVNGGYDVRLKARIAMHDHAGNERLAWILRRALPVKFKAADLSANGTEIGIEELHLAHEGLELDQASSSGGAE